MKDESATEEVKKSLKPCPFCGGEASIGTATIQREYNDRGDYKPYTGYFVNCIYCGADNQGITEGYKTPETAAEKWNTRSVPSERATNYGAVADYVSQMKRSAEAGELYGFADDCSRLLAMLSSAPSAIAPNQGYTKDQQAAADYICGVSGDSIGGGNDPVSFLISSHQVLRERLGVFDNEIADLVDACEMHLHNVALSHGAKGKAWSGDFVLKTMREAVAKAKDRRLYVNSTTKEK